VRPAVFDRDVTAFDEASFTQTCAEGGYEMCSRLGRTSVDISDHRHRGLLCARHHRPRRRAAQDRDEFAPPHTKLPVEDEPTKGQRCASQQNWPPNAAMGQSLHIHKPGAAAQCPLHPQ